MSTSLSYAIRYVADMAEAVEFHIRVLGLKLRFQSPGWSEFDTGLTTLALHPASEEHPAGSCELGFRVPDVSRFHSEWSGNGVSFISPPTEVHGQTITRFQNSDGSQYSASSPAH